MFFASKKSSKLQERFPKVAEGNSSLLHLPSRHPVRASESVVADIEYC